MNAGTKAVAARKANRIPGRLSLIPTATAAIASKPQIARRINVVILLCGVEKALIKIVSFLIMDFVYGCLRDWLTGKGGTAKTPLHFSTTSCRVRTISGRAAACLHPVLTGALGVRLPPLFGGPRVRCRHCLAALGIVYRFFLRKLIENKWLSLFS
jgi:hypothetical protein